MDNRSYYLFDHQGKGNAYKESLTLGGYTWSDPMEARVIFSDLDMPGRIKPFVDRIFNGDARFFVYPHAARVCLAWDGIVPSSRHTTAVFVSAEGHKQVLESYGFKKPVHVAGWSYCQMMPFLPVVAPRRVLFAPIHPSKRGWLSEINKRINAVTFQKLLILVQREEIELWVRYIGRLEDNGLWLSDGVNYLQGSTDLSYEQIDAADIIVARETFAYIAVARGKPVVMMAEGAVPHNSASMNDLKYVNSWDAYKDIVMYPHDILNYDDTMALFNMVSRSDESIRAWRSAMIGNPFDTQSVVAGIEKYL